MPAAPGASQGWLRASLEGREFEQQQGGSVGLPWESERKPKGEYTSYRYLRARQESFTESKDQPD